MSFTSSISCLALWIKLKCKPLRYHLPKCNKLWHMGKKGYGLSHRPKSRFVHSSFHRLEYKPINLGVNEIMGNLHFVSWLFSAPLENYGRKDKTMFGQLYCHICSAPPLLRGLIKFVREAAKASYLDIFRNYINGIVSRPLMLTCSTLSPIWHFFVFSVCAHC